jgi:ABC-type sugar transport system substrate-binding protein
MSGKKVFVALAVTAALGVLGAASAAANDRDDRGRERGGFVVPCSLDGVNPVLHPEIFGNAATAQQYGFVQAPDHTWHVRPGCHR